MAIAKEVASGGFSTTFSVVGKDEVGELMQALKEMMSCLSTAYEKLRDLSRYDALTGVHNTGLFQRTIRYGMAAGAPG
ncbi:HAMP domain-containing protein [Undibacterium sp. TS12]|nr:HAMP domain-containing protein [Undibacterium sp. TS12]